LENDEIWTIGNSIYQDDPTDRSIDMIHYFQFAECVIFCQIEMAKNDWEILKKIIIFRITNKKNSVSN
jgi:hypothetical protein